jgi:hypothetical protein
MNGELRLPDPVVAPIPVPVPVSVPLPARTSLERLSANTALYVLSMFVLLSPAIWNGFPFMFYDTGAFIEQALKPKFVAERQVFYAWFLLLFFPTWSLWPVVIAQAAITVWVMRRCVQVLFPRWNNAQFLAVTIALTIGTGMPWYVGQVLPDFLTPLLVLSLYLLGCHADRLNRPDKVGLAAVAVLAATAHSSHLGLAAGLAVVTIAAQWLRRRNAPAGAVPPVVRPQWRWPAAIVLLSIVLMVGSNYVRAGELFLSRAGSAFIFGRLVQDGIAKRLLDDTCPQSNYILCPYKDQLKSSADEWLWAPDTPFWKVGGFEGNGPEYARMTLDSLKLYPWLHLKTAVRATVTQFFSFRTGDGIEAQTWPTFWIVETFLPELNAAFRAAPQQKDEINFRWLNGLHVPVGNVFLAVAAGFVVAAIWRRRFDVSGVLPAYLLIALLGNAFICGVLSNPHDRYQSRMLWTVPFALALLASRAMARETVSPLPRTDRSSPSSG